MGIIFKSRFKADDVKKSIRRNLKTHLEKGLEQETTEIIQRTQSGRDAKGRPFKPYSRKYAEYRVDHGRFTSPVDLTFTGDMLKAIHSKVRKNGSDRLEGVIYLSANEADKARSNMKKRKFFGLSKKQRKDLLNLLRRNILDGR